MHPANLYALATSGFIFIGLTINLVYITNVYLKFETKTNEATSTRDDLMKPQVSLCYDVPSVVAKKRVRPSQRAFRVQNVNRTMDEIFSMVPAASESLSRCSYRDFDRDVIIHESNGSVCASMFNVTRYRVQSYICYTYDLSYDGKEYRFYQITRSLNSPRLLASLTVNFPLNISPSVYPLVHTIDREAMQDRIFNQPVYTSGNCNELFKMNYYEFETTRLPPPYDTQCSFETGHPVSCFFNCLNDLFMQRGLVSESSLVEELNHTKHLLLPAYDDPLLGPEVKKFFHSSQMKCASKCNRPACHEILVKTSVSQPYTNDAKLTFEIETVKYPLARVIHSPKYNLWVFLTETITLLAIWIDFSLCSCLMMVHLRPHFRRFQAFSLENERLKLMKNIRSEFATSCLIVPADLLIDKKKSSKKNLKKLLFLCLILFSLIYLSVQLCNLFYLYFLYKVDLFTTYIADSVINYPSLSLCLDVQSIFNEPLMSDVTSDTYEKEYEAYDVTGNHSLSEMFNQAAQILLIKGCTLRNWTDFDLSFISYGTREQCLQELNLSQLWLDSFMCARFKPNHYYPGTLTASFLRFQPAQLPGIMYILHMHVTRLQRLTRIRVILDYSHLPHDSTRSESYAFIPSSASMFVVSSIIQKISYLPAPYETNCVAGLEHKNCLSNCLQQMMSQKLNLLPMKQMLVQRSHLRVISFRDLKQENIYSSWRKIDKLCGNQCSRWACEYIETQTRVTQTENSDYQLAFAVAIPSRPSSLTHTVARMTLYSLLFNLMCSVSFWTGFTFISFAPISKKVKQENLAINRLYSRCQRLIIFINYILKKENPYDLDYFFKLAHQIYYVCDVKSRFIYLMCVTGCSLHLTWAVSAYLSYPTIMNTDFFSEDSSNYSLSLCIESDHLIKDFHLKMDNLTEVDLFSETPGTDVIQSCMMRGLGLPTPHVSDKILFRFLNATECYSIFKVTKYLMDSDICYLFSPIHHNISFKSNLNLPEYLYAISVNSSLLSESYRVALSDGAFVPHLSINWAHREPSPPLMSVVGNNHHLVTYRRYDQAVVPYPYNDNGMIPGFISWDIAVCAKEYFFSLNKTAVHSTDEPVNLTFFSPQIESQTVHFPSLFRNCYELSRRKKYEWSEANTFRSTKVASTAPISNHHSLDTQTFYVLTTDSLAETMNLSPALTIIDLIITFGSILGLWFGFSVLSVGSRNKSQGYIRILLMKQKLQQTNSVIAMKTIPSRQTGIPIPVPPAAFQVQTLWFQRPL